MVRGLSAESRQGGGQLTPLVHSVNMEKWQNPYPICKRGQGSNCDERRITILGYEKELVPRGGPEI